MPLILLGSILTLWKAFFLTRTRVFFGASLDTDFSSIACGWETLVKKGHRGVFLEFGNPKALFANARDSAAGKLGPGNGAVPDREKLG